MAEHLPYGDPPAKLEQNAQKSHPQSQPQSSAVASEAVSDYTSQGVLDHDVFLLPLRDYHLLGLVTAVSALVRLFRIYQPSSVVFDEVHFGGFASKYIKGRFFMDVHPPLAKMLIALTGWLAGFDGSFDFKGIGTDYLKPNVPYVAMRLFPAICGILVAPITFLTLKSTGCRTMTALLGASFVIFENGLLTQARLILLDSPLLLATAFTALAFTAFTNQHEQGPARAFDLAWWFWLVMTGLGLGVTLSIKWVGLFTIAWVGCLTLVQLWVLLGDTRTVTMRLWTKHFLARAVCLILIPATIYLSVFAVHFSLLTRPGEGDGFMSSEFQSTLRSKAMRDVPADVLLGSSISLRHVNTHGGYLHSHPLLYPTGSKQQQITLYPHKDNNNIWLLENETQPLGPDGQPIRGVDAWSHLDAPAYVTDRTVVRLYHKNTHRRLHSHDVRAPVTEADWQNEVSAYGYQGFDGDANDLFRVEIVKARSAAGVAQERVRTIQTKFRLVHIMTGCVLFSHKVKLPEWASEQQEVTCARGGSLPNSLWYVESNEHPMLGADAEKVNYARPGFFRKFLELNVVMWKTNAGLTASHSWESRPESWPLLQRGINFWSRNHRQIYMLGNPFVWWLATASIVAYVLFKVVAILRWQRSYRDYDHVVFKRYDYETGSFVLGWALHYFPFFIMGRQLFLHHYFPALYFSILAFCQTFDYVTARFLSSGIAGTPNTGIPNTGTGTTRCGLRWVNKVVGVSLLVLSVTVFMLYAPLAYGNPWTKGECRSVKLFSTWDWNCGSFYDTYQQYEDEARRLAQKEKEGQQVAIETAGDTPNTDKPVVDKPVMDKPVIDKDNLAPNGKDTVKDTKDTKDTVNTGKDTGKEEKVQKAGDNLKVPNPDDKKKPAETPVEPGQKPAREPVQKPAQEPQVHLKQDNANVNQVSEKSTENKPTDGKAVQDKDKNSDPKAEPIPAPQASPSPLQKEAPPPEVPTPKPDDASAKAKAVPEQDQQADRGSPDQDPEPVPAYPDVDDRKTQNKQ